MDYTNIPSQLTSQNNWVCWSYEQRPGQDKPTKIPKNPRTGGNAASNLPDTWADFNTALKAATKFDGVGFMLDPANISLIGVDIDNCIDDNGIINDEAIWVVSRLNSYTEISPSGRGLRVFIIGTKPGPRNRTGNFEMYDKGRYLTVTGNQLPDTNPKIRRDDEAIAKVYWHYFKPEPEPALPSLPQQSLNLADSEIVELARAAKNGAKFEALYSGNFNGEYKTQSEADLALCGILGFWTQGNVEQIDRIVRTSGLYRDKWDSKRGDSTYGLMTANQAVKGMTEFYTPPLPDFIELLRKHDAPQPENEYRFKDWSIDEFIKRPPKQWLIEGLLGKSDLSMIFGDAASGKTFTALDILMAAASGRPIVEGKFSCPDPISIAYCAGEGVSGLPGRLIAIMNKYDLCSLDIGMDIYVDIPQLYDLESTYNMNVFIDEIIEKDKQYDLIVLDTLHASSVGADENHAKDAGIIISSMKRAQRELKAAVMLVHHANKAGGYRGSTALHGAMDSMFQTTMTAGGIGTFKCFKQKDAEHFNPLNFMIVADPLSAGKTISMSASVQWVEPQTVGDTDKTNDCMEAIMKVLETDGPKIKKEMVEILKGKFGDNKVKTTLDRMYTSRMVTMEKRGMSKIFSLNSII